jgi:DNA-binding MarR family transcriptional regulator
LAALVRRTAAKAVLFAGDHVTDEDAFGRDLGAEAVTVRIGPCGARPGCSPGEAARHLRSHPASITRLVAGLESLGLVRRRNHLQDRRRVQLELTARGRAVAGLRAGTIEEGIRSALARADPGAAAQARAFLREVTASLAASHRRPGARRTALAPGGPGRPRDRPRRAR